MPTPDRPLIRHPLLRQYGGIVIALIILCTVFTIANSRFLSLANFMNIFQQVAVVAIAAFGMTWVILLGEIDLSVGSIIAVAGMVGAQSLALGTGFPAALLITIIAGAILGAVNGLLTARLRVAAKAQKMLLAGRKSFKHVEAAYAATRPLADAVFFRDDDRRTVIALDDA